MSDPTTRRLVGYDLALAYEDLCGTKSVYALSLPSLSEDWEHLKSQVFDSFVASFQDQDVQECRDKIKSSKTAIWRFAKFLAVKDFGDLYQAFEACCFASKSYEPWETAENLSDCNKVYTLFEDKINAAFNKVTPTKDMIILACLASTLDRFGPCKDDYIGGYSDRVKDDAEKNEYVEEQDKTEGANQAEGVNHAEGVNQAEGVNHAEGVNQAEGVKQAEGAKTAKNEGDQVDETLDQGEEDVETNVDHLDHKNAHDEQQAEVKLDYNQKQKQIYEAISALVVATGEKARLDCELVCQTKVCRATFKACTPEELREMHKMLSSMKTDFANAMSTCIQLEADLKALCAQCS